MIYIGKACGRKITNGYLGSGIDLTPDIKKYGGENFRRITIDFPENRQDQNQKEIFWIAFYREILGRGLLYNIADGGDGGTGVDPFTNNPNKEKIRIKQRIAKIGEKNPMFGKHHSEESKKKSSISHTGIKQSKEHRMKNSRARKERFKNKENHPMYGTTRSDETKRRIGESQRLRYLLRMTIPVQP